MSLKEIAERVLLSESTTVIANAFRRAFSLPSKAPAPKRGQIVSMDAYADIEWCMKNYGSPLDGRI